MSEWQLKVLGSVSLRRGEQVYTPDRKSAAILSYLSLEGPTSRSKLAGLLWPDVVEATARNNLAQTLRRLRQLIGDSLIAGDDVLSLRPDLSVDIAELNIQLFSGNVQEMRDAGELLNGLDFDDSPDFADWLYGERERLLELRRQALAASIERLERSGRFDEATRYAKQLIDLDPVAETPHYLLMRLHYLAGNRSAALKAYARCRNILAQTLGIEPLPETTALARKIEQGEVYLSRGNRGERSLPAFVLRPPVLIGREQLWAEMETAWQQGQFIILAGDPGVGKTRLALDFAASKGAYLFLEGRPGDRVAPRATSTRNFRRIFEHKPDLELATWARRALAQVMPEIDADDLPPQEVSIQLLLEAVLTLFQADLAINCFVYDDLQFADDASIDTGFYIISSSFPMGQPGGVPHWIACVRPNELSEHTQDILQRGVAAGHSAWIEVTPLDAEATTDLLSSLELNVLEDALIPTFAQALYHRTGGNALFILETLRNLLETRGLGDALSEPFPLPTKVEATVRQRLARLSAGAQRVVQAAAVLQSDFDLKLIGKVLGVDPVGLIDVWEELERAQVFKGHRFSHDLLYESALGMLSEPIRVFLNLRAAEVLEEMNANPGRVAKHYLAASEQEKGGRFLLEAAGVASQAFLFNAADALYEQAEALFTEINDATNASEALLQRAKLRLTTDPSETTLELTERLLNFAKLPEHKARALEAHARILHLLGRDDEAERAANEGATLAAQIGDAKSEGGNLEILGLSQLINFRPDNALATFERVKTVYETIDHPVGMATAQQALGNIYWHSDHYTALRHFETAETLFEAESHTHQRVSALNGQGLVMFELGDAEVASQIFKQAQTIISSVEGEVLRTLLLHYGMSLCYHALGDYTKELSCINSGVALGSYHGSILLHLRAVHLYLLLGDRARARTSLEAAGAWPADKQYRFYALLAEALLAANSGEDAAAAFDAALREAETKNNAYAAAWARLERAPFLDAERALDATNEALGLSEGRGFEGLRSAALTRSARTLLTLERHEEALVRTMQASKLKAHSPVITQGERLLTHAEALQANGKLGAKHTFEEARTWVIHTAEARVPAEHRRGFLGNSVNGRILDTGKAQEA